MGPIQLGVLDPLYTDSDYGFSLSLYRDDETSPEDFTGDGCILTLLKQTGHGPREEHVLGTVTGEMIVTGPTFQLNLVQGDAEVSAWSTWSPGPYDVQLRRLGASGAVENIAVATLPVILGLSQRMDLEAGGPLPGLNAQGGAFKYVRGSNQYRIIRAGGVPGLGLKDWVDVVGDYTASHGDRIKANTADGSFTIELPLRGEVWIRDVGGAWGDNQLLVHATGRTIGGDATLVANAAGFEIHLVADGDDAWTYSIRYIYGEG